MRGEACKIFMVAESIFLSSCVGFVRSINAKDIVATLLRHPDVVSNYALICDDTPQKVSKEFCHNLLDHLLTLYIRVRSFSFARDVINKNKLSKAGSSKKSLC